MAARHRGSDFPKAAMDPEDANGRAEPEVEDEDGSWRDRARQLGERMDEIGARGLGRVGAALQQASDAIAARAGDDGGAQAVAEPLRRAGRYVAEQTPSSALADLDRAIERHPYRSLAIGLGVGWMLGRFTRRLRAG
jgi:ElaB/YqjD/DUF883 family membrane-anchored ribosome-binding protein